MAPLRKDDIIRKVHQYHKQDAKASREVAASKDAIVAAKDQQLSDIVATYAVVEASMTTTQKAKLQPLTDKLRQLKLIAEAVEETLP